MRNTQEYQTPTKKKRRESRESSNDADIDLIMLPKKVRAEILQPVTNKEGVYKSHNSTKVGTVNLDISFLFTGENDPFPDCVNLGLFRKRLLIEVCTKIKTYFVKNEILSKDCSLYYFSGSSKSLLFYVVIFKLLHFLNIFNLAGCTGTEVRSSEDLLDILTEYHQKVIKKRAFKLSEYTSMKLRFAFGRRDVSKEQEQLLLASEHLSLEDSDHLFSQKEPDSPAVATKNNDKRIDSNSDPIEIGTIMNTWYNDDNPNNPLYWGFYFQMKQAIKKSYLHAATPINRRIRNIIMDCMKNNSYPSVSIFKELFEQPHVKVSAQI